ncbi:ArsR/SmtB family transcription factor [Saccharomonospora piscinae]|uniref:ArsR/SmtB family transcription factor n=1 Tax=Saccharomonospora piscinae TaxID=687388 RepID=UPI000466764B|nr:winged helix-turn-helix domain-containing protein [Saccharomonospora piscinae]
MSDDSPIDDLRVLAHPLRLRILSLLTGAAMSAAEIARELDETQANVSYHVRRLHAAGLLAIDDEVQVRGGRAKRYRHDHASGPTFAQREADEERVLITTMAQELRRRAGQLADDDRRALVDAELWVDEDLWQRALATVKALGQELHDAAKPPRTPGTRHVNATAALFPMADE